ncbi:MAG: RNA-binding domain-containing protein [Infirmifilum sp.]
MIVLARAPLYATEAADKVVKAIKNVLGFEVNECNIEGSERYQEVICRSESHKPLEKLSSLLRSQRILDAARSYITRSSSKATFTFYLNKQAAFQGRVSFCSFETGESPLGAITVIIDLGECNPDLFLNWLAPETRDGRPINEEPSFRCT